ncbi:MAG TPA: helix-turn-helix domain-containing protein [Methanoregula sp.]|nr:helix-turn-helix domain-containing protein [Methanoregula sp.]
MPERPTLSVSTDPEFLGELSEYLEVLSNPVRLRILKLIEHGPLEISEIAERIGSSYQNTKKHLDRLVGSGLVRRGAGFSRETERGIAPVWKYSLVEGSLETLVTTMNVFGSFAIPPGYSEIRERIGMLRSGLPGGAAGTAASGPVLFLISGPGDGRAFPLHEDRTAIGREDPGRAPGGREGVISLPDPYRAVTRVTKPHAYIIHERDTWQIEDNESKGGTYLNSRRLAPLKKTPLSQGDVIDLSVGSHAARFLFISPE